MSSTHNHGSIQPVGYINDTAEPAPDNDRIRGEQDSSDLDVVEPVAKWGVVAGVVDAGLGGWCVVNSYRPVLRDQAFLLPPDMREWLPSDHLVWFLLDTLDWWIPAPLTGVGVWAGRAHRGMTHDAARAADVRLLPRRAVLAPG